MGALLGLLRMVPAPLWIVAAVLAWGGWQKHRADAAAAARLADQRAAAEQREKAFTTAVHRQAEVIDDATDQARRARADADAAGAALRSLRQRAAAAAASHPAAAGASAPAGDAAGVLADMLGRCGESLQRMAAIADERGVAGQACERAYDALTQEPKR